MRYCNTLQDCNQVWVENTWKNSQRDRRWRKNCSVAQGLGHSKDVGIYIQASLPLLQSRVLDIWYPTTLTPGFLRREGQTDSSIPHLIFQNAEMKLCSSNTPCSRDPHHFLVWIKGQHVYLRAYWKLVDCLSPTNHKGIYSPWKELWNHSQEWWAPQHRSFIWKSLASISTAPFGDMPLNSL